MNELPFPVSDKTKIAPGSLLTERDQVSLYAQEVSAEAAARQVRLARMESGKCVCDPSKVSQRWEGASKKSTRTVHRPDCPRWKQWMAEARS